MEQYIEQFRELIESFRALSEDAQNEILECLLKLTGGGGDGEKED